ncbi:MAG: hypothetical protein CME67_07850 [Halobacteriovoraceae bacterium]|nr:hypothetical protein [Peredibacter sp.]MBJ01130.1 hypothetical protein [Halobacteriovoraceae bacterium]|tara:strand:+ start:559 stop:861 length:303 start_codon:yes stop_codon:yes gene_type:complete
MIKLFSIGLILFSMAAQAKDMIKVNAIGSSPKGQFVAFEEFGKMGASNTTFSYIRVKNVWKNKYVDRPIKVVSDKDDLNLVRAKAKQLAKKRLEEFNISS